MVRVSNTSSGISVNEDSAWNHSQQHVNTSSTSSIDSNVLKQAIDSGKAYSNVVTAYNEATGSSTVYSGWVLNGVTYTESGQRVVNGGNQNQNGLIPGKNSIQIDSKSGTTFVSYYQEPVYYPPVIPVYPSPPSYPTLQSFTEPAPTFNSNLKRENRFIYFLGIDKIEVKAVRSEPVCIRVSEKVDVGNSEWIELEVDDYIPSKGSIEYYIVDGDAEIPILPNGSSQVVNEQLFPNLPTRFQISEDQYIIKKDGVEVPVNLNDAKNLRDGRYSASYNAKYANIYYPVNSEVQIKMILRTYGLEAELPYVKSIKIKTYGGEGVLWQEN